MDTEKKIREEKVQSDLLPNSEPEKVTKRTGHQGLFWIALVVLIAVVAGIIGYRIYKQLHPATTATQKTVIKQEIVRRSVVLGVITRATTAKAIDVKTGKVIQAARIFSLDDKTVYLALELASAKSGTFIDYIRYLNGRYVDHGNVKISKDSTNNITFNWTNVKPLGSIGDGNWKIATYTNGILEKRVNYIVKKSAVSYVYPNEEVSKADLDYHLPQTFAALVR